MSTVASHQLPGRVRRIAMLGAALFVVSTAFPVIASGIPVERRATLFGWLDAVIAFALVAVGVLIDVDTRAHVDPDAHRRAYAVYRGLIAAPLVLFCVFFLVGNAIDWTVLLTGLAWRAWLFAYILPGLLVALGRDRPDSINSGRRNPL